MDLKKLAQKSQASTSLEHFQIVQDKQQKNILNQQQFARLTNRQHQVGFNTYREKQDQKISEVEKENENSTIEKKQPIIKMTLQQSIKKDVKQSILLQSAAQKKFKEGGNLILSDKKASDQLGSHNFQKAKQIFQEDPDNLEYRKEQENFIRLNQSDPQFTGHYVTSIFDYLQRKEKGYLFDGQNLKELQKDLNEEMREILVDWMVHLHRFLKLKPNSLQLAIKILDLYIYKAPRHTITKQWFQKLGVACLFISFKYEETKIFHIDANFLSEATEHQHSAAEILETEGEILRIIQFDLQIPTVHEFLKKYSLQLQMDDRTYFFTVYLSEILLYKFSSNQYSSSSMAAASLFLALSILNQRNLYQKVKIISGYDKENIKPQISVIWALWIQTISEKEKYSNKFSKLIEKFARDKMQKVSKIRIEKLN